MPKNSKNKTLKCTSCTISFPLSKFSNRQQKSPNPRCTDCTNLTPLTTTQPPNKCKICGTTVTQIEGFECKNWCSKHSGERWKNLYSNYGRKQKCSGCDKELQIDLFVDESKATEYRFSFNFICNKCKTKCISCKTEKPYRDNKRCARCYNKNMDLIVDKVTSCELCDNVFAKFSSSDWSLGIKKQNDFLNQNKQMFPLVFYYKNELPNKISLHMGILICDYCKDALEEDKKEIHINFLNELRKHIDGRLKSSKKYQCQCCDKEFYSIYMVFMTKGPIKRLCYWCDSRFQMQGYDYTKVGGVARLKEIENQNMEFLKYYEEKRPKYMDEFTLSANAKGRKRLSDE